MRSGKQKNGSARGGQNGISVCGYKIARANKSQSYGGFLAVFVFFVVDKKRNYADYKNHNRKNAEQIFVGERSREIRKQNRRVYRD